MKQLERPLIRLILLAALGVASFVFGTIVRSAHADQGYLPLGNSANYSRACAFDGVNAQTIAVSGTAAASTATGVGVVRIWCSSASHFEEWARGVTGTTATTGSTPIAASTPEYVLGVGGKFSFIQDSASGTCFITECK